VEVNVKTRPWLLCGAAAVALVPIVLAQTGATADQASIDELVLINRMLASSEMGVLGAYGHVSVRNRNNPSHYFISRSVSPGLVTASDIYESDLDSKPIAGARTDLLEDRFLHGEIYRARPDVMAIVYTCTRELAALSVSSVPLRDSGPMPIFDTRKAAGGQNGFVNTAALGRALAAFLGRGNAALMLGQGAVVVSSSTNDVVSGAMRLQQEALQRLFAPSLGKTSNHVAFARDGAAPEARANLRTGNVERVDRFSIFFNYLGARDLARIQPDTKASAAPYSDQAVIDELVIANRLLASSELGVLTPDGLAHVSARSRTNPNHFFIAHDVAPGMVTAADIIEDDLDAKPVKAGNVAQYSERFIHSEIYRARPDIMAVLHAHTPELRVFGQSLVKLRPVSNRAIFIGDGLPIYDIVKYDPRATNTLISSQELGRSLVGLMGKKDGALLLDHGIALADYSVRGLVSRAYNLRNDARIQQMALSLGGTVYYFEPTGTASRGASAYPEWDYWRQLVIGSADVNLIPKPAAGLPLRPHQ
jgi:HCOMODA/2-hydroxy-3-carboxy-muconic semialdehyde decarboxylase